MENPLVDRAKEFISFAKNSGIEVRLVSGDNIDTVTKIARDCGILKDKKHFAMDAADFRKIVLGSDDCPKKKLEFYQQSKFNEQINNGLKVLARADPDDKKLMTIGL